MTRYLAPLWILFLLFTISELARAQEGVYEVVVKKQEKKESSRWTLADWLGQKERIRMMDYWLAMNTSDNPFEFSFGLDAGDLTVEQDDGTTKIENSRRATQYSLSAFATIVGISGRLVENSDDYNGTDLAFNLRLLGSSQQNTNITLEYGQYVRSDSVFAVSDEEFKTSFYGGSFTLYFIKHFGIKARYMDIQEVESSNLVTLSGNRTEFEAFIDYGILRIYGQMYSEPIKYKNSSGSTLKKNRDGIQAGLKVFF